MALVVETGAIIANADTFASVEVIVAFANSRGRSLPQTTGDTPTDDTAAIEVLARRAMDFISSYEGELQGERVSDTQLLPYPRSGVYINGFEVAETAIPQNVINLQCQLVCELAAGVDVMPTSAERPLKRQKTGPLEKEWFDADTSPIMPVVEAWLLPLLANSGSPLRVVRV